MSFRAEMPYKSQAQRRIESSSSVTGLARVDETKRLNSAQRQQYSDAVVEGVTRSKNVTESLKPSGKPYRIQSAKY